GDLPTFSLCQHLRRAFVPLRCIETDPNSIYFFSRLPERYVFLKITRALHHRTGYGPVNIDLSPADILEDPGIGGRFSALVMVFRTAVNRNRDTAPGQLHPLHWNRNDPARHHQSKNALPAQFWQNLAQLTMSNQRLSANQRHVQRAMFAN